MGFEQGALFIHAWEQPGSKVNAINFHPVQNAYPVQINQIPSLIQVDDHPKVLHAMMTLLFWSMRERIFELDKMAAYTLVDHLAQNMYFTIGAFYTFKLDTGILEDTCLA